MTWSVQRAQRPKGTYYTAIHKLGKRSVTLGFIPGEPAPAVLTARLREHDPEGLWTDGLVTDVCLADGEDGVRCTIRAHRQFGLIGDGVAGTAPHEPVVAPVAAPAAPPMVPMHPKGAMLLRVYVAQVWTPVRSQQRSTWKHEAWWWDYRILPMLGDTRLCDLNAESWASFLRTLTVGGRAKSIAQTAYRVALTYVADVLEWIPAVHRFAKIDGSTRKTLAEPEPMTIDEVGIFLSAAPSPMHRALFGVQIGQGLRPGEVIRVRWEDVNWDRRTIYIRGSKNNLAKSTVPLTPLSVMELSAWWERCGKPAEGIAFEKHRGEGAFSEYPKSAFRSTAIKSGLEDGRDRRIFPYLCRHTFATIAAVSGIDRTFTKDMMRHSRASSVMEEAYIRVSKAETAKAFSAFGAAK